MTRRTEDHEHRCRVLQIGEAQKIDGIHDAVEMESPASPIR